MDVKIKICGIRRLQDASAALEAGADYIGLIFYRRSPRSISLKRALALMKHLRCGGREVKAVGVFVNAPMDEVVNTARALDLFAVQLHGDEPPEYVHALNPVVRTIKAFRIKDAASLQRLPEFESWAVLFDAYHPSEYGGTGQQFNYDLLKDITLERRVFLAGGLTADNVAEAERLVRPFALDVSSGVEKSPGVKDPEKIRRFVAAARRSAHV
ncbi:MAG: phosphoribosylanthranilate isomerase [Candidatus Sumerlaeia bacterium]